MGTIVDHVCEALECERATVFQFDLLRGELWSQPQKGDNKMIKIPMDRGLAGWVCVNKEVLNIRDAYSDERFDPKFDQQLGVRTKS
jgi:signal transduction protein with GAF and PtsI domain